MKRYYDHLEGETEKIKSGEVATGELTSFFGSIKSKELSKQKTHELIGAMSAIETSYIATLRSWGYGKFKDRSGADLTVADSDVDYWKKALLIEYIKYATGIRNRTNDVFRRLRTQAQTPGKTTKNQRRFLQAYLYIQGAYAPTPQTMFQICDGVIGSLTMAAKDRYYGNQQIQSVPLMRDSITGVNFLGLGVPADSLPAGPVKPQALVKVPNNKVAELQSQIPGVIKVLSEKIKSVNTALVNNLLKDHKDAFLQYLAANNLLDIKNEFKNQGLAKSEKYKAYLNLIEERAGMPKNALYGVMMTECKGNNVPSGQYVGPFHQGTTFGDQDYRADPIRAPILAAASLNGGYFDKAKSGSHSIYSLAHALRNYNGNEINKRSYPGKVFYYMGCLDDTPNQSDVQFLANQYLIDSSGRARTDFNKRIQDNGGEKNYVGLGTPRKPKSNAELSVSRPLNYIGDSLTNGYAGFVGNDSKLLAYPGKKVDVILSQSNADLKGGVDMVLMTGMNDAVGFVDTNASPVQSNTSTWLQANRSKLQTMTATYKKSMEEYISRHKNNRSAYLCTIPVGRNADPKLKATVDALNNSIKEICSNGNATLIDVHTYVRGLDLSGEVQYKSDGVHLTTGNDYRRVKQYVDYCAQKQPELSLANLAFVS